MKSTDLRLGNFIKDRGGKTLRIDFLEHIQDGYDCKFGQLMFIEKTEVHPMTEYTNYAQPIILTKEWFEKFGFTMEDDNGTYYIAVEMPNHEDNSIIFDYYNGWYFRDFPTEIKYVHQLQNFYYMLTGTELKIS